MDLHDCALICHEASLLCRFILGAHVQVMPLSWIW